MRVDAETESGKLNESVKPATPTFLKSVVGGEDWCGF